LQKDRAELRSIFAFVLGSIYLHLAGWSDLADRRRCIWVQAGMRAISLATKPALVLVGMVTAPQGGQHTGGFGLGRLGSRSTTLSSSYTTYRTPEQLLCKRPALSGAIEN
jgi:hypothetical protein